MESPTPPSKILKASLVSDRCYAVGRGQRAITLRKQQVRALNLLYALREEEVVKRGDRIAVVGGGAAGLTAAAAAAALGVMVDLFERRPNLLHLQSGCDIRWIHPHLYDWPREGAERAYAALPLLDWHADTASGVAEQLIARFDRLLNRGGRKHYRECSGIEVVVSEEGKGVLKWNGTCEHLTSPQRYGAVVLALGFGIERRVGKGAQSYWRNDSVNQVDPKLESGDVQSYLVSGVGDGGLIDLLRVRLRSFNQGRIVHEIVGREYEGLREKLRKVQQERTKEQAVLFGRYNDLKGEGLLDEPLRVVRSRLRRDTRATLNGKEETFEKALNASGASILNTFLAYLLDAAGAFEYLSGEYVGGPYDLPYEQKQVVVIGSQEHQFDRVLLRHGTETRKVYTTVQVGSPQSADVGEQVDASEVLWPLGWWGRRSEEWVFGGEQVEYVPRDTQALATTFVSSLSDVIGHFHKEKDSVSYRLTLHRLISHRGSEYFQQITRYAGTDRLEGKVGRVFDVNTGLVGLACRMGNPVIAERKGDDDAFAKLWAALHLTEQGGGSFGVDTRAREVDPDVESLLACPFVTTIEGQEKVNLVLFVDTVTEAFFEKEVRAVLFAACAGFARTLETMREKGEALFAHSDYTGVNIEGGSDDDEALIQEHKSHLHVVNEMKDRPCFSEIGYFEPDLLHGLNAVVH